MVEKLKPKACDRMALLEVTPAGSFYSKRGISPGSDTRWFDRLRTFLDLVNGGTWPSSVCGAICLDRLMKTISFIH